MLKEIDDAVAKILERNGFTLLSFNLVYFVNDNKGIDNFDAVEFCKACRADRVFHYRGVDDKEPICSICGHAKGW